MSLMQTWRFLRSHPLTRERPLAAILRFGWWQVASRLAPGPIAVPFVDDSRLLVRRGMTGATGNIYAGLHEFEEMGFVLHFLRPGDLFVDVGANVGSYTVLASAVAGARTIAFEPVPASFAALVDNVRLNGIEDVVELHCAAAGRTRGQATFTADLDAVNHALPVDASYAGRSARVPVETLDAVLDGRHPNLIKIDVEGFESEVLQGASGVLGRTAPDAMIIELNGSGMRYGFDEGAIRRMLLAQGFVPCRYRPCDRTLQGSEGTAAPSGSVIYVRNKSQVLSRVNDARRFSVLGRAI